MRLLDIYVLEGDQFLFRVALSLLQLFEARLFNPDHEELVELFKGNDRGARIVAAREWGIELENVQEWMTYEVLGAKEDVLMHTVEGMEWKEGTYHRLLTRELPEHT